MLNRKLETAITAVLVLGAVSATGLVVYRQTIAPTACSASDAAVEQRPTFIAGWRRHLQKGVRVGSAQAPVQLLEFVDFECPFCRSYYQELKTLRERYPSEVALTYVYLPLEMHRFAEPAARVAECAGAQGRFEAMYDRLFEEQQKFGLKAWDDMAQEAGVRDLAAFDACIARKDLLPRVEEGKALGKEIDVQAVPTLVINGWKLSRAPHRKELDSMVKAILAGKPPVSATTT